MNKTSVLLLAVATIYALSTILILYWNFLPFPPIHESIDDIKYALGFFYGPLAGALLSSSALVLKLRTGSEKLARLFAQVGLVLSTSLIAWWLTFETGFLLVMFLPALFLLVVINDVKETRN